MKIKTAEAIGPALDWLVESIEIARMRAEGEHVKEWWVEEKQSHPSPYSTDWLLGGPIIERELCIATLARLNSGEWRIQAPYSRVEDSEGDYFCGPTPLIAAMRCYVASKLGTEVEVPEELK
jgi:hypothetical protein